MSIAERNQGAAQRAVSSRFSAAFDASSFGSVDQICKASSARLKGFVWGDGEGRTPIVNDSHIGFAAAVVREGISRLSETGNTRLSVRTVASNDAVGELTRRMAAVGASVEAVMPIGEDYSIIYIGYNSQQRELGEHRRQMQQEAVAAARRYRDNPTELAELANDIIDHAGTYTTRIIDGNSRNFSEIEISSISGLLATFGYDANQARSMVENEQNIIGLVYQNSAANQRTVVGISITERRSITLANGRVLQIAELTDGTVSKEVSGRSLYSRLLLNVYEHILASHPELSLIFAESNVGSEALLKAAFLQGREEAGMLPNHVEIRNRETNAPELKSLLVTYLTRERMAESIRRLGSALEFQQVLRN